MRTWGLACVLVATLAGCGDDQPNNPGDVTPDAPDVEEPDAPPPDAPPAPPLRNAVALDDATLAIEALRVMGGPVANPAQDSCRNCHSLTRQQLSYWRALSDTSLTSCLTDLAVGSKDSALTMLGCLRAKNTPTSDFQTQKLGIYSAAAHLPWFQHTFQMAYGETAATELARFGMEVGMPREGLPLLTQEQFDIMAEWFARGLPRLEDVLPEDPPPETCQPGVSAAVGAHVAAMQTQGWRALNRMNQMAMFGCGAETDPKNCLQTQVIVDGQEFGAGWDMPGLGHWRQLANVEYETAFWTRSSPDGRFVGHGVRDMNVPGSLILDLQRGAHRVLINAQYDPNWFPDNSGFVFQGGNRNVCGQSVLTSNPDTITTNEAACARLSSVGLYEHVGRALDDGDYFSIDGEFVSDDGGHGPTHHDPYASFGQNGRLYFTPLLWTGTQYAARTAVRVDTPFEGDSVLSPSARLVISRVEGPSSEQLGFVLRQVNATPVGATYDIEVPEVARYCVSGGKPAFSYDERWVVFHRYVTNADAVDLGFTGPNDPGFAPYREQGAANAFLMELATGEITRISNVHPGQYALFPHFRSDGWIYADVRDPGAGREYMVASDAALLLE